MAAAVRGVAYLARCLWVTMTPRMIVAQTTSVTPFATIVNLLVWRKLARSQLGILASTTVGMRRTLVEPIVPSATWEIAEVAAF